MPTQHIFWVGINRASLHHAKNYHAVYLVIHVFESLEPFDSFLKQESSGKDKVRGRACQAEERLGCVR